VGSNPITRSTQKTASLAVFLHLQAFKLALQYCKDSQKHKVFTL